MRNLFKTATVILVAGWGIAECAQGATGTEASECRRVICGYAAHSAPDSINPQWVNRIIYSHIAVDSTLSDVVVRNPDRLRYVAGLRDRQPGLEVMVSFGGPPGLVSQAMRSDSLRGAVVDAVMRVVDEYGLDGVDIDWEYPGRGDGALSEKEDVANYVQLLRDLRGRLGNDRLLTIACAGSGYGVDYTAMAEVLDNFNIMCYDMGVPPSHHSALYPSDRVGWICADVSVRNFLEGGVPPSKIVLGMPFYGRGRDAFGDFTEWRDIVVPDGCTLEYDAEAQVPWIADSAGEMILSFDNPRSLEAKCDYIKANSLAGAMYWRIEEDDSAQTLARTVFTSLR